MFENKTRRALRRRRSEGSKVASSSLEEAVGAAAVSGDFWLNGRQPEPLDHEEAALPSPLNMHPLPVTPDTPPV